MDQLKSNLPYPRIFVEDIDSTNTYANTLLSKTNPIEGTAIWADFQQQGRGQIGRSWESEKGQNLLFSVVLYPDFVPIPNQFLLSMAISAALLKFVKSLKIADVSIKWPNDIYIQDNKVAGILIQNQLQGKQIRSSIVGVGLNVNQSIWSAAIPNPTSLYNVLKQKFDLEVLLASCQSYMMKEYLRLKSGLDTEIYDFYHNNLYKRLVPSKFNTQKGIIEGHIIKVRKTGEIEIQTTEGVECYAFREISFLH